MEGYKKSLWNLISMFIHIFIGFQGFLHLCTYWALPILMGATQYDFPEVQQLASL